MPRRRRPGDRAEPPASFVAAYEGHGGLAEARRVWRLNEEEAERSRAQAEKRRREPASIDALASKLPSNATFRSQLVQCGKKNCRKWHGPYWYAFWWSKGRTRSAYVGSLERAAKLQHRLVSQKPTPQEAPQPKRKRRA
jgi:hypothetical protein